MKCQHEWEKIAETTLPSGYEQIEAGPIDFRGADLFQKKYILVLFCKKCGDVKKIVESNPN